MARISAVGPRCGLNTKRAAVESSRPARGSVLKCVRSKFMNSNSKKSIAYAAILIVLGIAALCGGMKFLVVLIPAALVFWYSARPTLRSGRN
jgi:hypothetical protein